MFNLYVGCPQSNVQFSIVVGWGGLDGVSICIQVKNCVVFQCITNAAQFLKCMQSLKNPTSCEVHSIIRF